MQQKLIARMKCVCYGLVFGSIFSPLENKRNAGRPVKRTFGSQSRPRREQHKATHVSERLIFVANTRAFRCSNVSPEKRGSSLTSTLYREMKMVSIAINSVSAKLRMVKYPASKISNTYTLHTVVPRKHEHLRIWEATKKHVFRRRCRGASTQLTVTKRHESISVPVFQKPLRNKTLGVIPISSCTESIPVIGRAVERQNGYQRFLCSDLALISMAEPFGTVTEMCSPASFVELKTASSVARFEILGTCSKSRQRSLEGRINDGDRTHRREQSERLIYHSETRVCGLFEWISSKYATYAKQCVRAFISSNV